MSKVKFVYRKEIIDGLDEIFADYKATPTVRNVTSAAILVRGAKTLLVGVPGTGKTTLLRMLAKSFFSGSFEKVPFSDDLNPFDVFYYIDLGKLNKGTETIEPRPILNATMRLWNELGRCPKTIQNELLEVLEERQKTYRGKTFPVPVGIDIFDMNPADATSIELGGALLDRIDVSVQVPALNMKQEFELLYGLTTSSADLVEGTKGVLKPTDMINVWDDVDNVQIAPPEMFLVTLLRATVSSCRYYDRSRYKSDFIAQHCPDCTYKGELCSQLKKVVAFRGSKATENFAKAFAWLRGDAAVNQEDIIKAFAVALPHRIKLHPAVENEVGGVYPWVTAKFIEAVKTKQTLWKSAAGEFGKALKGNKTAKEALKELGNKDIAIQGAYEAWFGGTPKGELFKKVLW